jgi:hypothetical protein
MRLCWEEVAMPNRRLSLLVLVSALSAGLVGAQPDRVESPQKAVKRIAKAFGKLRSYQLAASVQVGEAIGEDSQIVNSTVSKQYRADVVGTLCQVESPRAYRPRHDALAGAIQAGTEYKRMLTTDDGRLLARLLPPAERFLAEASRFKKTARWLDLGTTPDESEAASADADDGDDGTTRTGDSDDPDSSGEAAAAQPRHLRVTGPSTVALEHFISVTNSGCFSEG